MISLILLFPLLGFLINGLWYGLFQINPGSKKASALHTGVIASIAIFCSFIISLYLFFQLLAQSPDQRLLVEHLFSWMTIGDFTIRFAFQFDVLSSLFCLVITGVGTLIHIYSIGYMSHDATPGKYFAYLNLFCFSMLILVLGSSLPLLFMGWEGVGLCSYLLIGYWYEDNEKAIAGKKAFVVNRVGDFGFLIGMFLIFTTFGTLEFIPLQAAVSTMGLTVGTGIITLICLMLFLGCTGKSAQIPLFVWLPDAMAGPTPVSALIHAATMVTSGIYLLTRLNFIFVLSPDAMATIAWVGGLTAFMAATIAFVQTDIKKVLAYSTVSQLGYMFLACGVGAFGAGVFHVITHAFFKALMFMGAGSVIYSLHHEQDMMKMGGLKKSMPITHAAFFCGWLAICGVFFTSGFFSKDEILWYAWSSPLGSKYLWLLGFLTAMMTAFYMTRLMALTFWGKSRVHHDPSHPVSESPNVMTYPLLILAALSLIAGFIGIPILEGANWLKYWLGPVLNSSSVISGGEHHLLQELILMGLSGFGALIVMYITYRFYTELKNSEKFKQKFLSLHKVLSQKWYIDEIYEQIFVRSIYRASNFIWKYIDVYFIDFIVIGFGRTSMWMGLKAKRVQTGEVQFYSIIIILGMLITLGYLVYAFF